MPALHAATASTNLSARSGPSCASPAFSIVQLKTHTTKMAQAPVGLSSQAVAVILTSRCASKSVEESAWVSTASACSSVDEPGSAASGTGPSAEHASGSAAGKIITTASSTDSAKSANPKSSTTACSTMPAESRMAPGGSVGSDVKMPPNSTSGARPLAVFIIRLYVRHSTLPNLRFCSSSAPPLERK